MSDCKTYNFYGFTGNFCTWEWNWTVNTVESYGFHIFMAILYCATVKLLQIYVEQKKNSSPDKKYVQPAWLESAKLVHNYALALTSGWMCLTLSICIILDGRLNSWHSISCNMTKMTGWYGFANFVFLVSKVWEWVDTYFLILSGKKVIFLHWFHHMTTFTLAAVTHNFPAGGFTLINCFIHTVMYTHYAHPLRWARPFITSGQLIQFVIVMTIHANAYLNPVTCYDMKPVWFEWAYCMIDVFIILIFFSMFFVEEYVNKGNKKGGKKGTSTAAAAVKVE